ncbi:MAG: hypothetical protein H7239_12430 [Flavobacterium sp.]|nr:hypothetical protein [Flavobacterium sp.]
MSRYLLILVFLGLSNCEAVNDMDKRIYELKAENEVLRGTISNLENRTDILAAKIDDLSSEINDLSIEDYNSQMIDVHSKLDEVQTELLNLKIEF